MTLAELIATMPNEGAASDAEVLAWLDGDVTVYVDVNWLDLSMWVAGNGYRPTLIAAAASGTDARKTAAQHILDCISAGQPLYASDARVRTALAAAIPAGAARDALLALASETKSRWATVMSEMDDPSKLFWIGVARNG